VFEHMADGVIVTDLAGRVIDWNPAASRIFGYEKDEMLGKTVGRLYRIDEPARLEARILDEITRFGRWTGELRFARRDGSEGISETVVFALFDASGARVAAVGVNRDVTERRRLELALADSYGMLEAVVEGTTDAIFAKDLAGRYAMVNSAAARLLARPRKDVLGRCDPDLFPADEARDIAHVDRRVVESGRPYTFEETITFDGRSTRLSTTKAPWRDAQGNIVGVIGVARDVTAVRLAEEEMRQHQAELAHLLRVRTVGEMAAGLAHEINQPLAAIANYAKGCVRRLREAGKADAEVLAVVEEIALQALRAGTIVHRLGEFVRNRPVSRQVVDLGDLVRTAVRLVEPDAVRARVQLRLHLRAAVQVEVDPIQIEQVLLNLLRNGVEAMREEDGRERVLSIRSAARSDVVRIEVADTGPGLRDAPETLFAPFYSTKTDGMGMGLTISRSIVDAHGGRLWASEAAVGGAVFHLELRRC
jgi:PAS domain S-box-containing protein